MAVLLWVFFLSMHSGLFSENKRIVLLSFCLFWLSVFMKSRLLYGGKKMAQVRFEKVTKRYGTFTAVRDLNIDIPDGEFVTFVGPSGCGKTTSLRMVAGLEEVTAGILYIGDRVANNIPSKDRGIAMVFQSYALFPHMTVGANIAFGLKIKKVGPSERMKKVQWALELLDLQGLGDRHPRELSGGQRQRVALGRALVLDPEVLLLDEPLSNLDAKLRLKMRTEIKRIHKTLKSTVVYVTHDQVEAMTLSDRVAIMNKGELMQVGSPKEVYSHPQNIFVADFIGSPPINFLEVRLKQKEGNLYLVTSDFELCLPDDKAAQLRKYGGEPRLMLGIRPQDIHQREYAPSMPWKENRIKASIDVLEPLGDAIVATVIAGKQILQATLPPEAETKTDHPISLAVDMGNIHLFDPDTGESAL